MFYMIMASGLAGIFLGRFARVYALIPAAFLLIIPVPYLVQTSGFAAGLLSFWFSLVAMQLAYFVSMMSRMLIQAPSVSQAPPEHSALTDVLSNL